MLLYNVVAVCGVWISLSGTILALFDSDSSFRETRYTIPGINLDYLDTNMTELAIQEEMYKVRLQKVLLFEIFHEKLAKKVEMVDLDKQDIAITKYELSKRESLGPKQIKYIMEHNPKCIVIFKDTKTVLIPDKKQIMEADEDEIRARIEKGESLKFEEYDTANTIKHGVSPMLIPASPCLKFVGDRAGGAIVISYQIGLTVSFSGSGEGDYNVPFNTQYLFMSLKYISGVQSSRSVSFSGTYTCNGVNGTDIRLFYKAGTIEAQPRRRNIIFETFRNSITSLAWNQLPTLKGITDSLPIYYCSSSDKMDLMCDKQGADFTDDSGVNFKSQPKQQYKVIR